MLPIALPIAALATAPFEPNISNTPNLNGAYILSQTPRAEHTQQRFPSNYKDYPGGAEYFDVYSPEISSLYSQVFWKGLPPVDLPPEVVRRYAGRGMAIVGFEMDQVIAGAAPDGSDVSVPLTHAYNHHFESTMTGAKSTVQRVDATRRDELAASHGHGHGLPHDHYEVRELAPGTDGMPTSQAFGGANGGECTPSRGLRPRPRAALRRAQPGCVACAACPRGAFMPPRGSCPSDRGAHRHRTDSLSVSRAATCAQTASRSTATRRATRR
jgi:hypothetical protein